MSKFFPLAEEEQAETFRGHSYCSQKKSVGAISADIASIARLRTLNEHKSSDSIEVSSHSVVSPMGRWSTKAVPIVGVDSLGETFIQGSDYILVEDRLKTEQDLLAQKWAKWREQEWCQSNPHEINPCYLPASEHALYRFEASAAELIAHIKEKFQRDFVEAFYVTSDIAISRVTLHKKTASVPELITQIQTSPDLSFANKLAARLDSLYEASKEEFPEQKPLSPFSMQDFIVFLNSLGNVKYPDVVLTYEGNIRAEWKAARNKHFAVEFNGNNDVRFVVFSPDPTEPHKTNRVSGMVTIGSIYEQVAPYGVFAWVQDVDNEAA